MIGAAEVAWCRAHVANLAIIDLGPGIHFLPKDYPEAIGAGITGWLGGIAR